MADFNGTSGDDIFTGGGANDTAHGNGGNDTLSGAGGNDLLAGGSGSDTLDGGDEDDTLYSADYTFFGPGQSLPLPVMDTGTEVDTLRGGAGNDRIFAGYGDNVDGGTNSGSWGDILLISFLGASSGVVADFRLATQTIGGGTITGIEGVERAEGSNYDDDITLGHEGPFGGVVYGLGGNDRLVAGYYTTALYGGEGNDTLDGTFGSYGPLLDGGAGNDTLTSKWGSQSYLYGGDGNDIINSGGGHVRGGAGNDIITLRTTNYPFQHYADEGDDQMNGCEERDIFFGGAGADVLYGNNGDDFLYSADGNYYYLDQQEDAGAEQDQLFGGIGNDRLVIGYGDSADGGTGTDTLALWLTGAAAGVTLDTGAIFAGPAFVLGGGTIQSIEILESLKGSAFADTLTIATQAQLLAIDGGDGDDVITSFNSSIAAMGGNGNDRFINGNAGDTIDGGAGIDTVDYRNAAAGVTVMLAAVAGQSGSGPGGDSLKNIENIDGSGYGDTLHGSDDANFILGNAGADAINGRGGADIIIGGDGLDQLYGGTGNDTFYIDDASGDVVHELAAEGSDRVYVALSYALAAGSEVEVLSTNNHASTDAINLTGNGSNQTLIGNAGENILHGGGGADLLIGLGGRRHLLCRRRDHATDRI